MCHLPQRCHLESPLDLECSSGLHVCLRGLSTCLRSWDSCLSSEERPKKRFFFFPELLYLVFISKGIIYWCNGLWVSAFLLTSNNVMSPNSLQCKIVTYRVSKAERQIWG